MTTQKNASTEEQRATAVQKIKSLPKAMLPQNQHFITECAKRAGLEKSSTKTLGILINFAAALEHCDFQIDDTHKIVERNAYAIEKAVKFLKMFKTGLVESSTFDKYSEYIIYNAKNHKMTLDSSQQRASLCVAEELSSMSAKDKRLHAAPSTSSTQRSSTCYALHAVGLAAYDKKTCTLTIDPKADNYKRFAKCKK